MSWRVSVGWLMTLFGVAASGITGPAHAADAYLCGPDQIVYVEVAELEHKKRTDPCIAAYYGLKIDSPETAHLSKPVAVTSPASAKSDVAGLASKSPTSLRKLADVDLAAPAIRAVGRQAALNLAPFASPNTDYRNVRILNAATAEDAWYRHTR